MFWRRKKQESMDVEDLLARARADSPEPTPAATDPSSAGQPAQATVVPTGAFSMPVDDVFSITGRGTVVTGQVVAGSISVGQLVSIMRGGQPIATVEVLGVEQFRSLLETARAGDNVGLLLKGIHRSEVAAGDVIAA